MASCLVSLYLYTDDSMCEPLDIFIMGKFMCLQLCLHNSSYVYLCLYVCLCIVYICIYLHSYIYLCILLCMRVCTYVVSVYVYWCTCVVNMYVYSLCLWASWNMTKYLMVFLGLHMHVSKSVCLSVKNIFETLCTCLTSLCV